MTPKTRKETYLAKAAGDDVSVPSPITREEVYLNALATGEAEGLPDPVTREEVFLKAAAEGGGGEKYPTGTINFQIHGAGYDEPTAVEIAITCVGGFVGEMNISPKQGLTVPSGSGVGTTTLDNVLMPEEGSYAYVMPEKGWTIQIVSGDAEQYGDSVEVYGDCTLDLSRKANYKSKLMQVVDRTVTELKAEDLGDLLAIGGNAFYGCVSLASIVIPSRVGTIGVYAFRDCTSLTSITIPSDVRYIGISAFQGCTSLTSVTVEATTPPTLGTNALLNTHADLVIYVPSASVATYQAASGWSTYASKIQAIPNS